MTDFAKRLGYGGSAVIDGIQVLITGGSFENSREPTLLTMLDIDPSIAVRSNVLHSDGVLSFTGSLSFDVTEAILPLLTTTKLLGRYYSFDVGINDGNDGYKMTGCSLTSLGLSGDAGGLISASVSFSATDWWAAGVVSNTFIRDGDAPDSEGALIGYWWSGNTDVKSWTFTMSQDVQARYANRNITTSSDFASKPLYLKVGMVSYTLETVTYSSQAHEMVYIATKSFKLSGFSGAGGYSYGGQVGIGEYSHTYTSTANATTGSGDTNVLLVA